MQDESSIMQDLMRFHRYDISNKSKKMGLYQIKKDSMSKNKREKTQFTRWEKIFPSSVSDKGLTLHICMEFL